MITLTRQRAACTGSSGRQAGSRAGRATCSEPKLQNIPIKNFRKLVRAPDGRVLIKADYSQVELRIAAQYSRDRRMIAAYKRGDDLHELTAQRVLGWREVANPKEARYRAKPINFGLIYGIGRAHLQESARTKYGVEMTLEQAERYRQAFFRACPGLRRWRNSQPRPPTETRTLGGRRRLAVWKFTEMLNSPIQGTGSDGLKLGLALLFERLPDAPPGTFPILTVHDEVVVECPAEWADKATAWLMGPCRTGWKPSWTRCQSWSMSRWHGRGAVRDDRLRVRRREPCARRRSVHPATGAPGRAHMAERCGRGGGCGAPGAPARTAACTVCGTDSSPSTRLLMTTPGSGS